MSKDSNDNNSNNNNKECIKGNDSYNERIR